MTNTHYINGDLIDTDHPLPITGGTGGGDATAANQTTLNTEVGGTNETAPASDTAASGLNGRLQRIAQRLTSLIALVPAALTGSGNFKTAVVEDTAHSLGSGVMDATTQRVVLASDGPTVSVLGATTDASVSSDANGSINAHLRGLVKLFADVWDSANHWLKTQPQPPNTAVAAATVTVGTGALALPSAALANRKSMAIYNNGSATIYLGPSGVTTASGLPVLPGQSATFDLGPGVTLYGISGTAGQDVRVLETS